ncbi:heme o synthase [Halobacteriovorax sp. ZH4_bin.1]|uniref:heme o synthase n=1 Tax=unclassified Halobacteriovorax TaxID=2639665 RepID=UPI00371B9116
MYRTLAFINILLTLGLIVIGGLVSADFTGLECTSWPICYAATVDKSSIYPILHRIFAGIIIVLNTFLFIKHPKEKSVRLGLFLLVLQSLLGGINFIYKLPTLVSVFHLILSFAYIAIFSQLFYPTVEKQDLNLKGYSPSAKDLVFIMLLIAFIQFFFGGIVHQTATKDVCGLGDNINILCQTAEGLSFWPSTVAAQIHSLHKYLGVLFLGFLLAFLFNIRKTISLLHGKALKQFSLLTGSLVALFLIHLFNAKRLFLLTDTTYFQVLHLLLAVIITLNLLFLFQWFKRFEEIYFGGYKHTVASDLLSLTKPRLGLLVVSTIVSGILLTGQYIDFFYLINALIFSILIVMSATTINCYMEIEVDSNMVRTKDRALPAGRIKPIYAVIQGWILFILGFSLTYLYVNKVTALLGALAFFSYLYVYTPMKRKSPAALFVGALPGAIPPVMGRTIVTGEIDGLAILLFAILFIWQIPHFMAISIYHKDDYKEGDIKVYPHTYSVAKMKICIALWTFLLALVAISGYFFGLNSKNFFIASLVVNGVFFAQSLQSFFIHDEPSYVAWARQYFWGSIIYLPLLLSLMIFLS